jgi:hypothetical protein
MPIRRRIQHRMLVHKMDRIEDYVRYVQTNTAEIEKPRPSGVTQNRPSDFIGRFSQMPSSLRAGSVPANPTGSSSRSN